MAIPSKVCHPWCSKETETKNEKESKGMGLVHEKKEQKDREEASEKVVEEETKAVCQIRACQKTIIRGKFCDEQKKKIIKSRY